MKLILVSLGLLTGGMALAFLMVIRLLDPSFVLSFLAYAASLAGLMLGISATVQHGVFRGWD
jgi:hypothetical protein